MKKLILPVIVLALASSLAGEPKIRETESASFLEKAGMVSLVQLISTPERYHGKEVIVSGYLHNEFEDSAIYFSKEFSDHNSTTDAFWVGYDKNCKMRPETEKGLEHFDRKWVTLKGKFNMKDSGHFGMFQGTIEKVSMISAR